MIKASINARVPGLAGGAQGPGPIRILELRASDGPGGGPEKTILFGAAMSDPAQFQVTVCYLRREGDREFDMGSRASALSVDFVDLPERQAIDFRAWNSLRRLVRERRVQLVHAHDYKSNLLALWLASREPVVPLTTAHGWTGHRARERWLYYPLDRRLLLTRFPRVIAVSSEIRASLLSAGVRPDRVQVVLNGIDHEVCRKVPDLRLKARNRLGISTESLVLGSVGRLEPQKRFDLLIDTIAVLARNGARCELVIAGDGSQRWSLEQQIGARGLSGQCRLLGHVADMQSFYHALDLFVQSSDYEGTPNVVLEAMAYEVPIVATNVGGTSELVRSGVEGWIVAPGSSTALADAIQEAVRNPVARRARVTAARQRVEGELSFRSRMHRVETIYRDLVGRSSQNRNTTTHAAQCST